MRLFVAVELDPAVRERVGAVAARLRQEIEGAGRRWLPGGATWVAPANMHLTLRFLGETEDALAERIRAAIESPFADRPFALQFEGVGLFPPSGRPRVLWIGITEGVPQLAALAGEVGARLEQIGLRAEDRPFRAHLTLARFREPGTRDVRRAVGAHETGVLGRTRVTEVVLFESRLSPKGPAYTARARGPLAGR